MRKFVLRTLRKFTGDPTFNPFRSKSDYEHVVLVLIVSLAFMIIVMALMAIGFSEFTI